MNPGNHEIEYFPKTGRAFEAYEARYFMPAARGAEGLQGGAEFSEPESDGDGAPFCTPSQFSSDYRFGNAFYSFEAGLVHVCSLNCYGQTSKGAFSSRSTSTAALGSRLTDTQRS